MLLLRQIAKKNEPFRIDLIKRIHKICFRAILPDHAGSFRTVQVTYSGKDAPFFSKINELMKNLCDDSEYALSHLPSTQDETYIDRVVELLASFQHRFVFIHPFVDFNGRMARMLTNYILMRLDLPIIEISVANENERSGYVSALKKADEGDYRYVRNVIARALNDSLLKIQRKHTET